MKLEGKRQRSAFSMVELLCWLAVVVICMATAASALRSFDDASLTRVEAGRLQLWLEGEMARADRSSRSRTLFLVHSRLLKAQYSDRPYEVEEFHLGKGWHVAMARATGLTLPSVVYRPVVHTVTPAFTLTVRQEKEHRLAVKMILSGRGALRTEEIPRGKR